MQNFIVLGIIPGTSIQLNFSFWLSAAILLACLPVARALWRHRYVVRNLVVGFMISRVIAQYRLVA
jgi:hypothetical protein